MPKNVEVPGLGIVEFPDAMSEEQILTKVRALAKGGQGGAPQLLDVPKAAGAMQFPVDIGPAAEFMTKSILPTAGAVGGALLPIPGGTILGSMGGEVANQAIGLTEPSMTDVGLAGASAGAGALAGKAGSALKRAIVPKMPGAQPVLHEMAGQQLEKLPAKIPIIPDADLAKLRQTFPQLGPQVTKDELYTLVNTFNPPVQMKNMRASIDTLLTKEQQAAAGLKLSQQSTTATDLAKRASPRRETVDTGVLDQHGKPITRVTVDNPEGAMSFQDIRVNLRRVGDKIRETREMGGEEHGAWKKLFAAIQGDLDAAVAAGNPAMPAVQALKAANLAAKREFAVDEISHLMSLKGGGIALRADLAAMPNGEPQIQVNLNKIISNIKKSDDLERSLGKAELKALTDELGQIARRVPALPPPAGVNAGSMRMLRQTGGSAGVGTAIGGMIGGPPGAAVGGGMGAAIGAFGPMVLAKLMVTPTGREMLARTLTRSGGTLSADALAILGASVGMSEMGREIGGGAVEIGRDLMGGLQ